jgi:uncharacterized protein YjeT (DUF2065 family)
MRDFSVAIGLVLAIQGLLMAGFTNSMRARMAIAAREDPAKLRGFGLGAAFFGVAMVWASRSLL